MDHFLEEVVVNHKKTATEILFVLSNILMVITGILGIMQLSSLMYQFNVMSLIAGLVTAGCAVLLWFNKDRLRTEYEYTFTNGELDFAQVFNNQKRKSLGTMRVKNVENFGPVDSEHFRRLINMPGLTRRNWFLNRGADLYYFYYQKESTKNIIVFEPSKEMVDLIRKYLPFGAYQE